MKKIGSLKQMVCTMYLAVLFIIYPLYQPEHYFQMGVHKYKFYLYSAIIFILAMIVAYLYDSTVQANRVVVKGKNYVEPEKRSLSQKIKDFFVNNSWIERFVYVYLIGVIISYLLCKDKELGMWGADGWNMGLVMQLILIFCLLVFDYFYENNSYLVAFSMIGSSIVFFIAVINRFGFDPLNNYEGLNEDQIISFLTTIGQSSWYGSYLITVFPLGVALYFISDRRNKIINRLTIAYLILTFATYVTHNSEGSFFSLLAVYLVMFWIAIEEKEKMFRLMEIVLMMSGTFTSIGLLQRAVPDRVVQIGSISFFLSKGPIMPIIFVVIGVIYILFTKAESGKKFINNLYEKKKFLNVFRIGFYLLILLLLISWPVIIYLNTKGIISEALGTLSTNEYLLFNEMWGNRRGASWTAGVWMFRDFSITNKLFGIGPDSLEAVSVLEPYARLIATVHGDAILSCLHNEYFNSIICYGLLGGISYIGIFIAGFVRYMKMYKKEGIVIMGAMCIAAYVSFNFFCYQTVCCTPFLFVIIGVCENYCRKIKQKDIK